jgi:hypothetical protein
VESGSDKRRHERFGVRLRVSYAKAEEFVSDYVENLSVGGLFLAGAHELPLMTETDVKVDLPGQGSWTVRARVTFLIDEPAALFAGRRPGAGMEVIDKPAGYDDALLGYLLRLGRRRENAVMVSADSIGAQLIADAGYRVIGLDAEDPQLLAVVVAPTQLDEYRQKFGESMVFAASGVEEMHDILARIDSLL